MTCAKLDIDPLSINLIFLSGRGNNTRGCAESGRPAALTHNLVSHKKEPPPRGQVKDLNFR